MSSRQQKPSPQNAVAAATESYGSSSNEQIETTNKEFEHEDDRENLQREADRQMKDLENFEGAKSQSPNRGPVKNSKNNADEDAAATAVDQKAIGHADADDTVNALSDQLSDSTDAFSVIPTKPEEAIAASKDMKTATENDSVLGEDEPSASAAVSDRIESVSTAAAAFDESAAATSESTSIPPEDDTSSEEVDIAGDEPMIEEAEDENINVEDLAEDSEEVAAIHEDELEAEAVFGEANIAVRDAINAAIVALNDDEDEALDGEENLEDDNDDDDDDSSSEIQMMIHGSPAVASVEANAATNQSLFPPWSLLTQNRILVKSAVSTSQRAGNFNSGQRGYWHNQLFQRNTRLMRRRFRRHSTENATAAASRAPEAELSRDKPVVFSRVDERNSISVGSGICAMAVSQLGAQQRQYMKSRACISPNLSTGVPCCRRSTLVRVSPEIFNNRLPMECQLAANSLEAPRQTYPRRRSSIKSTWATFNYRK